MIIDRATAVAEKILLKCVGEAIPCDMRNIASILRREYAGPFDKGIAALARHTALEEAAVAMEYAANSAAAEGDERGVRLFVEAAESIRALKEVGDA